MKKIYFVRHGETDSNANSIFSGSGDNPKLTEKGKQQAAAAGETLRGKDIELVIASPLERAKHTAHIIASKIDYDPKKIIYNDLLVERSFGYYDGKPWSLLEEHQAKGIEKDRGETMDEFHNRLMQAIERVKLHDEKTILIVSHGAAGRMLRVIDRELSPEDFHTIARFENCEVDEFTI